MQFSDVNKRHPLTFISQLPKERLVLDYVLSRLMKNSSPERYELIAAIFNLHLTSAGFDPMALSKARFKRVKASEFRQALREIDAEIALIMQTEEYRQVLTRQTYLPDLFQQYLMMSGAIRQSGRINARQFQEFAELLREKDASDLTLGFIRQHKSQFESGLNEEEIISLLKQFEVLLTDQQHANQYVSSVLELRLQELLALRGIRNTEVIYRLWNFFCSREAGEPVQSQDLKDKLLRTALLTAWPCRNLKPYLPILEAEVQAYFYNDFQKRFRLLADLSAINITAGFENRLQWLDEAENIAKSNNDNRLRAESKLIRARIMSDQGLLQEAVRFLDEAEYHIHRISEKDQEIRNAWINIAQTRVVVYALMILEENAAFLPAAFEAQQYLLNDIGKYRSDIRLLVNEINALNLFFRKNWMTSYELFLQASEKRKEEEPMQPMHIANNFFCELLVHPSSSELAEAEIQKLEASGESWFGFSWTRLLKGARLFYASNISEQSAL